MSETRTEFKLQNAPKDGITRVTFGPNSSQFLLVSSWDSTVRLYDITANNQRCVYRHEAPVLDCAFQDPIHVWSAGLDKAVRTYDINSGAETAIGIGLSRLEAWNGEIRILNFLVAATQQLFSSVVSIITRWFSHKL